MRRQFTWIELLPAIALAFAPGIARAEEQGQSDTILEAIAAGKLILSTRLRYETVDQDGFTENADAVTLRLKAGFETAKFADTSFLIEFEHVEGLSNSFNSTTNGRAAFPVVPDPDGTEINRLQFTNSSLPDTQIRVGRQRIIYDDSRFVGNVGWRQNEQTFDAISVENHSVKNLKLNLAYVNQVNRIFGKDSPNGIWNGDALLLNAQYKTRLQNGHNLTLTAFGYLLDFKNAPAASSQTYGLRATYKTPALGVKASYARQSDFGNQPASYQADYYLAEADLKIKPFTIGLGYEVLTGNGQTAFQTPLATLHKFNGWSDQFLKTPAEGLEDVFVKAGAKIGSIGPISSLTAKIIHHGFYLQQQNRKLGAETDFAISGKWQDISLLIKYARFRAKSLPNIPVRNTRKLWLQFAYTF